MRTFTASQANLVSPRHAQSRTVLLAACALMFAVAAPIVLPGAAIATPLASKQAQAAQLDQQVAVLEDRFGGLQERWRGAIAELREIEADRRDAEAKLVIARRDLRGAKGRLEDRALAIYRDGSGSSELQQVAEAGSFSDFFARLETIERVGNQDATILGRIRSAAERVQLQQERLRAAGIAQRKVVKRAERSKRTMRVVLDEKQQKLNSVTAEIRAIMEQQRAVAAARDARMARANAAAITGGAGAESIDENGPVQATGAADAGNESADPQSQSSVPLPPASGTAAAAASIAVGKSGSPYSFGAAGPGSFDCSGLVVWAFAQAGRSGLPHSTYSLIGMGVEVPLADAQVGDLIFTDNSGHMGIYVGGGSFVHAPRTGRTVTVEGLGYYNVVSVRRI